MKLVLYTLAAYIIIFNVIPFITTLIRKCSYYVKIKNICRKNNYEIIFSFKDWIFSSIRRNNPEMFIKTEKAVYSIKNCGFYKTPNSFVFMEKNNVQIQIVRMILWIGFVFLKNIEIQNINYDNVNKHFGDHRLPVLNVMLFCPKSTELVRLEGNSILTYKHYADVNYAFKVFGKTVLNLKSIVKSPYVGFTEEKAVPDIKGIESRNLLNGDMIYGAYVYNVKSFIKERLQSSDMLVRSSIEESRRKFESR